MNNTVKNKSLLIVNALFLICIMVFDILLLCFREPYIYKTIASVLFVLCGVFNFVYVSKVEQRNKAFKYLMLIGLVFACLGDIVLIDYFVVGAILFAIGHIFFFVSYAFLHKINLRDLLIILLIFALSLIIIFVPQIYNFNGMLPIIIVYALIISFMLGKSISNTFEKEYKGSNLWIMLGSLLFFLSDFMLLLNVFTNISIIFDIFCLVLYYPAEFILASSIYYANIRHNKQTEVNVNQSVN